MGESHGGFSVHQKLKIGVQRNVSSILPSTIFVMSVNGRIASRFFCSPNFSASVLKGFSSTKTSNSLFQFYMRSILQVCFTSGFCFTQINTNHWETQSRRAQQAEIPLYLSKQSTLRCMFYLQPSYLEK